MPSTVVRSIGYEDRLSIVDHLDELRTRLIVCIAAVVICFAFTYWQKDVILTAINKPFTTSQRAKASDKNSTLNALQQSDRYNRANDETLSAFGTVLSAQQNVLAKLAISSNAPDATVAQLAQSQKQLATALAKAKETARVLPDASPRPVTLGVTEPFVTTFTVAGYAALLLALPLILYQLYAFLLPALSPLERKTAVPFMAMVPVLFIAGVAFGYFVALPRAVGFLLNFNAGSFDILVGAQQYYKFSVLLLAVVGLLFQIPVGVLAITRLGIVSAKQLAKNRGYVLLGTSVVAAVATPTPDPFTMLITMAPLVFLFEASLLLARVFEKRSEGRPSRWDWDWDDDDEDADDGDGPQGFDDPPSGEDAVPDDPDAAEEPDGPRDHAAVGALPGMPQEPRAPSSESDV